MSYKTLVALVAVIAFIAVAALNLPASLQAAPLGQSNSPPAFDDDEHKSIEVPENTDAGDIGEPIVATDATTTLSATGSPPSRKTPLI